METIKIKIFLVITLLSNICCADEYEIATKKALEAYYIQSGAKNDVDRYLQKIEKRYVPVIIRKNGGWIIFLAETMINERIQIKIEWTFP